LSAGDRVTTQRSPVGTIFDRCKSEGRAALLAFLTAGYPSLELTPALIRAAWEGGADIIELGFPYSDPLADGPTIQASSQRALEGGATYGGILEMASGLAMPAPLLAFTYYNPLCARGLERAATELAGAGFAGAIVPDLPPEEAQPLEQALRGHGLSLTFLIAPTTPAERARTIAARSADFVYVVSRMGVTGTHAGIGETLAQTMAVLRAATDKPLAVGFGIAGADDARAVARVADGVVVGSALVRAASGSDPVAAVRQLCAVLSAACRKVTHQASPP
jgi:tryptophan synthase alpha chain